MNERQEAQWLYAKGLELAILLKRPRPDIEKDSNRMVVLESNVVKIINDTYD